MNKAKIALTTTLLAALAIACEDPAEGKAKAAVSEAKQETKSEGAADAEKSTQVLPISSDSKVGFVGSKVTGSHEGHFEKVEGKVELVDGSIEKGSVEVTVHTGSLKTEPEKLLNHLKAPDFFDTEKFPKAVFTSTEIKKGGEGSATHTVTGNLELRGVKKSISFPATIQIGKDQATAQAEFSINRKDFGIVYKGMPDDLIRDEVVMKIDIKAPRTKSGKR